jgi:hypothetical protein
MDAILNQVELLRRHDPSCEEFFSNHDVPGLTGQKRRFPVSSFK